MKFNKSCIGEMILNEVFKKCDILLPLLHGLFNKIVDFGLFHHCWSHGCSVPLFEKNDVIDINNYRGISLVSLFGKLFTSIISNRMIDLESSKVF